VSILKKNRDSYYGLLQQVSTDNDWIPWIKFFVQGIITQVKENFKRAKSIIDYYRELKDKLPTLTKSAYGITGLDYIFQKTYFNSIDFYDNSNIPRAVSQKLLGIFEEQKILFCIKGQGRIPNFYIFKKLIDIADGEMENNL
jgi:Fic family protein